MYFANGYAYRNLTHYELHQVLCREAEQRSSRSHPEWVLMERGAMCDAVNLRRARLEKAPITMEEVERLEQRAAGHSDYGTKFALYCTELIEETP